MIEQEIPWDRQPPGLEPLASWLPIPQILWFSPLWRDIVGGLAPTVTGTVTRAVSRGGVGASFQSGGILDFGDRFNEASFTNLLVFELPSLAATALSQSEYDNGASESLSSQYIDATAAGNIRLVRDGAAVVVETTAGGFIAAKREHWVIVSWDQAAGSGFICIDGQIRAVATPGTQAWVTNGRYVLGRRRPADLSATSDHIQYVHARWGRAFNQAEARRLSGGRYAELFAPRIEEVFEPPAAGGGTTDAAITPAAGASTASTLTGSSIAAATITAAAGVSTASALAGKSTAVASFTAAAGVSTTSTLVGVTGTGATITPAAGVSTTSTLSGSSIAAAAFTPATGASTASTLTGASTAAASFTAAAGVSTTSTLVGVTGSGSTIGVAAGTSTTNTLTGSSIAAASFVAAAGASTTLTLVGSDAAAVATVTPEVGGGKPRRREADDTDLIRVRNRQIVTAMVAMLASGVLDEYEEAA